MAQCGLLQSNDLEQIPINLEIQKYVSLKMVVIILWPIVVQKEIRASFYVITAAGPFVTVPSIFPLTPHRTDTPAHFASAFSISPLLSFSLACQSTSSTIVSPLFLPAFYVSFVFSDARSAPVVPIECWPRCVTLACCSLFETICNQRQKRERISSASKLVAMVTLQHINGNSRNRNF